MTNLKQIIAENDRKFNNWPLYQVPSNCTEVIGYDKNGTAYEGIAINHRDIYLRLIEGFREMIKHKMEIHKHILDTHELCPKSWHEGNIQAMTDLLSELGSINEIK
jgi:hypothetical protein